MTLNSTIVFPALLVSFFHKVILTPNYLLKASSNSNQFTLSIVGKIQTVLYIVSSQAFFWLFFVIGEIFCLVLNRNIHNFF